jgi:hypothetical protein
MDVSVRVVKHVLRDGRTILEDEVVPDPVTTVTARNKEDGSKGTANANSNGAGSLECFRVIGVRHDSRRRPEGRCKGRQYGAR